MPSKKSSASRNSKPDIYRGRRYDRVTEILSIIHSSKLEGLIRARGMRYKDQVFSDAADRGTRLHKAIELDLRGRLKHMSIEAMKNAQPDTYESMKKYMEFVKPMIHDPIAIEERIRDSELGISGTPDVVFKDDQGRVCIADFKSGEPLKVHWTQNAGYGILWDRNRAAETEMDVQRFLIFYIGKKFKVMEKSRHEMARHMVLFDNAINIYREFKDE